MEQQIIIKGKPFKTIYRNSDTYFTVALFVLDDIYEDTVIITGILPVLDYDSMYNLEGNYIDHPKYGVQFTVLKWEKLLPSSSESIIRYLSSPIFTGIGKKLASSIVEKVGENTLEKIKENPDVLNGIPRLTERKKEIIINNLLNNDDELEKIMQFFMLHNISVRNATRINRIYKDKAIEVIKENPYRLFYECDGFGFKTSDKIAQSLDISFDDERRVEAILLYIVNSLIMNTGDSYVENKILKEYFYKAMNKENINSEYENILFKCLYRSTLIQEDEKIYTKAQYDAKEYISSFLSEFPFAMLNSYDKTQLDNALNQVQELLNITYEAKQMEAIKKFFDSDLMILTGGPGTGKTTVVRGIVHVFKQLYPFSTIVCSAPTGRAAKRLKDLTDTSNSVTIHSLLQWDLETNTFGKNENEPLLIDLLIIDEFSMVDNWLFYNLLKASIHIKKICIIGDEDQLPSVGPGSLLKDLIDTQLFPLVRLDHIFRQQDGSGVIKLAKDIKDNKVNLSSYQNDVAFYKLENTLIVSNILSIVQSALNKGYTLNDVQVLSCMYKGSVGIDRLNINLQKCFNPYNKNLRELKIGYKTFRVNDKILQLKNQPDDDVYNGDIGILVEIEFAYENELNQNRIFVNYDGIIVEYGPENYSNITHAYCISIHKSQGSEYPIVILPIATEQMHMLEKRLIYTAITRAKKSVIILGDDNTFYQGVNIKEKHIRKSDLTDLIIKKYKNSN